MTRRRLLVFLLSVGAVGALFGTRAVSRSYVFPISRVAATEAPRDFECHTLLARDGVVVHALELGARDGERTIVYFHNNRESAGSRAQIARELHARGFGVLLVEYRGYGLSRGSSPSEEGLYLDAEGALDMLASRGVGPDRVVLWGTSLGTGVAAEMARRGRGGRLVLEAPYTSIPGLVEATVPLLLTRFLVPDHFDTLAKSDGIHIPTLVIHGDADEVVPFWMGERLARTIHGARFVRVVGAHHSDIFLRDGAHLLDEIAALGA